MQLSVDLSSWHFQQASEKAQWIICQRLNTERLRGDQKKKDRNWNWAEKWAPVIFLTKHYDWPQPAAQFRPLAVKHSEYPRMIHWAALTVNVVLQGNGCSSGCLSQRPQVTSTPHFFVPIPLQPTHVCLWMRSAAFKKTACGRIFCFVSVSRCRDSTSVMLRSFISITVAAEILLLLFPINDWFYV